MEFKPRSVVKPACLLSGAGLFLALFIWPPVSSDSMAAETTYRFRQADGTMAFTDIKPVPAGRKTAFSHDAFSARRSYRGSYGRPTATASCTGISTAGAKGIMQLMPATAREVGTANVFDPEDNIRGGARYLSMMLSRFNDQLDLALAAYNAGPGAVEKHQGIPPFQETQRYVPMVLDFYQQFSQLNISGTGKHHRPAQTPTEK